MLQRCRITGTSTDCDDGYSHSFDMSPPFPTSRPLSECEWKPFDLIRKRSGPHNLTRSGYDEEKCRNVLVRFCAHVPRNFQYKDGIQQIFLILREHLGDENLDLAGGVLYELIEVDCEHTDDPGAAFQRWRHDHMYRYADLELPHIPHMTTITSSIIPTDRLSRWRSEHADRYRFVLSDSSPLAHRSSAEASCIRNKKAWLIDHTLFISTRSEGTRPMRSPNPKQFHEMQWDPYYGATGRFLEERELPITSFDRASESSPPGTPDICLGTSTRSQRVRHSLSSISIIEKIVEKLGKPKKEGQGKRRRRSWMPGAFIFDSSSSLREKRAHRDIDPVPLPEGCQIPNAIFARKFQIVENNETLPPHLPISQMPTAESKATETIVKAATTGLLHQTSPWLFRGPFTPQLGFDGGLDYQWNPRDPGITITRFDLESPFKDNLEHGVDCDSKGRRLPGYVSHLKSHQSPSKRRGRVFGVESATEMELEVYSSSLYSASDETNSCAIQENRAPTSGRKLPLYVPSQATRSTDEIPVTARIPGQDRLEPQRRNTQLFENIEFTYQAEIDNSCSPATNRQTAIIERPDQEELIFHQVYKAGDNPRTQGSSIQRSPGKTNIEPVSLRKGVPRETQGNTRELVLSSIQQDVECARVGISSSRRVSHRVTGGILQPLRYNASGGWKGGSMK